MASMENMISPEGVPVGEWSHIVAVFEASSHLRIYLDGKLVTETTVDVPDSLDMNDSPLLIGTSYSTGEDRNFFNGTVDECPRLLQSG